MNEMTVQLTQAEFDKINAIQIYENECGVDSCDDKLEAAAEVGILDESAPGAFGELSRAYYEADSLSGVVSLVGGYNFYVGETNEGQICLTCCTASDDMQVIAIEIA